MSRCFLSAIVLGVVTVAPVSAQTQSAAQDPLSSNRPTTELQAPFGQVLPVVRPLDAPPTVPDAGQFKTVAGATRWVPSSAATALMELRLFEGQLSSIFTNSSEHYPTDSLKQVKIERGKAWMARLRNTPGSQLEERQLLPYAYLAIWTEEDTLAKRLFDTRLAAIKPNKPVPAGMRNAAVERALTLDAAVLAFSDDDQDSARLVRNMPIADAYAAQLASIPTTGFKTVSDSTAILYFQLDAMVGLLKAAYAAHVPTQVLTQSERILKMAPAFAFGERVGVVSGAYPYREVATILVDLPNGRKRLDSLNTRLITLATPREDDFTPDLSQERRQQMREGGPRRVKDHIAAFDMIGRPAPTIRAHAWLNTPDSLYAAAPRSKSWNDGVVRMLLFGGKGNSNFPMMRRVQAQFPKGVQLIFVTNTDGNIGPDIATPPAEVAWLKDFYGNKWNFRLPIALWAGQKMPGALGTKRPAPPTDWEAYHLGSTWGLGILIDGNGIVRGYEPLNKRSDEARMVWHINYLLHNPSAPK